MATKRLPAEERKKQILKCAMTVFANKGFHGATTKRIAQEAGIAEALLYRYFGSKKGLFNEVVRRTGEYLVDGLEAALGDSAVQPAMALEQTYAFYLRLLIKHKDLAKMTFLVSAELDDPVVRKVYLPHQERALRVIGGAVERWQKGGALSSKLPPRTAAWLLLGGYQVLALMKHSGRLQEVDLRSVVQLMHGILDGTDGPETAPPNAVSR